MKISADAKMFMFSRWIASCYADTLIDDKKRTIMDIGFKPKNALSVLLKEDGKWYKKQIKHFNEVVLPNYIKNGTAKDAVKFFAK